MTRSLWKGPVIDHRLLLQLSSNHILKKQIKMEYTKLTQISIKEICVSRNLTIIPYFVKQAVTVPRGQHLSVVDLENKHLSLKAGNLVFSKVHCIFGDKKNKKKTQKIIRIFKQPKKKKDQKTLRKIMRMRKETEDIRLRLQNESGNPFDIIIANLKRKEELAKKNK
jgi:ribosomal protein S19